MILTTSFHKTFDYALHAAGYRENHTSFIINRLLWLWCVYHHGGGSGLGAADQRLALFALSYLIVPKHGCWKNSDLILQLLWNFPSLTSFNCCNSTSQSKKPWNFLYTCLQEQGFIIMQNFYIFVISPRLSFPTDEGCISVGFVSTFCLRRGLDAGTQVGAVGAQHFPAGFGT